MAQVRTESAEAARELDMKTVPPLPPYPLPMLSSNALPMPCPVLRQRALCGTERGYVVRACAVLREGMCYGPVRY